MHSFVLLLFSTFLYTTVTSTPINRLIHGQYHTNTLWPTNRTLTWKLALDQPSIDIINIRQSILQALHDCGRSTHLSFREVDQHEKADFHFAFVSANHSAGLPFDGFHGEVVHSFPLESVHAGHIYFDSTGKWTHTRSDAVDGDLRSMATHEIISSFGRQHSEHFVRVGITQDEDDDQAVHEEMESTITNGSRSRFARSSKCRKCSHHHHHHHHHGRPHKHHHRRPHVPPPPPPQPQPPPPTTTQIVTTTTNKQTPKRFNESWLYSVTRTIKELKYDNTSKSFSDISNMIEKLTGILPAEVIPILQTLSHSYAKTTAKTKLKFAYISGILSKFVIKAYRVVQHGMENDDEQILKSFKEQLKTNVIDDLHEFSDTAQNELLDIHKRLLPKAQANKTAHLMKKIDNLKADLLLFKSKLKKITSEGNENQGQIDSLRFEKKVFEEAYKDLQKAQEETKKELNKLKAE
ncbi:unnamed protein product, partial [Adineta ricciae]